MSLWAVPWKCALLMSWCLHFNGFLLQSQFTDIMIETNAFATSSGALPRTTENQLRFFESCFFIVPGTQCRSYFLVSGIPQACLCPPRSTPSVSCLHLYNVASGQFRRHLRRMKPLNLFTSGGQHKIFW